MIGPLHDVVIVGTGPAGCVLANRLTEDPARSVVLLEAGPDYGPDPAKWPVETNDPSDIWPDSHSWGYMHAGPPPGGPLALPRARIVGGSSAINGSIWIRGSALDYDAWAALGNPGWSFQDLLPYFRRSEADPLGGPLHGTDGPVPITRVDTADFDPVERAFVAAAESLGVPWTNDLNGEAVQRPSIGATPRNAVAGRRMHAAFTYLAPARQRPNLSLVPDVLIDRVCFDGRRATGVLTADGREFHGRHVVLCAGSYGSPAILLRSGVGPANELHGLGIPLVANLPGVGENLLDHPTVNFAEKNAFETFMVAPEYAPAFPSAVTTLLKIRSEQTDQDTDLFIIHGQAFAETLGRWVVWFLLNLEETTSRGRVRLTSRDPAATLDIDHAYFSDPRELEACCNGLEFIQQLVHTQPLAGMLEPIPGAAPHWRDRDDLRRWARNNVGTTYHPSSTCRMGPAADPEAVVDSAGRVYGIEGLRVADASVFPTSPRANVHCTVVAVAEKLADTLLMDLKV